MKFLHTADWHLGASQHPLIYQEQMFPKLAEMARKHEVDFILCVGDVFDHTKPTQQVKDTLLKFVVENSDIDFIFTVGNHDYVDKARSYNSLEYLRILVDKVDNVSVYEEGFYHVSKHDVIMCVLTEEFKYDKERLDTVFSAPAMPIIVACHGMVPGYEVINGASTQASKRFCKKLQEDVDADYMALGDIHKRVEFTKTCFYPGSLVQKTFSCEDGIILVDDLSGKVKVEQLQLDLPKKVTLNLSGNGDITEAEIVSIVHENVADKPFLKLKFFLPQTVYASLDKEQIRNDLEDVTQSVVFDNDPIVEKRSRVGIEKIAKAKSVEEEVYITIDEDDTTLDKKKLKKVCSGYL